MACQNTKICAVNAGRPRGAARLPWQAAPYLAKPGTLVAPPGKMAVVLPHTQKKPNHSLISAFYRRSRRGQAPRSRRGTVPQRLPKGRP